MISFVLIFWVYYNISYLLTTTSLKNEVQWFVWVGYSWNFDEYHAMSWFFKSDNIKSNSFMSQCSCAILFSKEFIIVEHLEGVIVNIPEPVLKKSMLCHYMMKTAFSYVNKKHHRLLKHLKIVIYNRCIQQIYV